MSRVTCSPSRPRTDITRHRHAPLLHAVRSALLCLSLGGQALAAHAPMHPDNIAVRHYDIEAGPLSTALNRFARESGLLLSFDPALTRGLEAPALSGRYSAMEGLQRLLAGTGLEIARGEGGSYIVRAAGLPDMAISLPALEVSGSQDTAMAAYAAPRSSVHLSGEELERFGQVSPADILRGQPGVQVGDSRNGGALDVNIRGIQGQSRVAVTIDGTVQALDVYRGYAGTQQRSYIDPALIGSASIDKGPSLTTGAIGGSVAMRTIGVEDILTDGRSVGVRLTGNLWNNGVTPARRDPHATGNDLDLTATPRMDRGGVFGSDARSGSIAFAYRGDRADVVAAFARRNQGNYFAGKRGQARYRTYDQWGDETTSVASTYNAGEEVLNSSSKTESVLLKTSLRPADGHTLELGYRHYDGRIGEIMPSDIFRSGTAGIWQYPLGHTRIDTLTARHAYHPVGNELIDLRTHLWGTDARSSQLTGLESPTSQFYRADRGWNRQHNRRVGAELVNTSRFTSAHGDFKLDVGGSFQYEDLRPQNGVTISQHDLNANRMVRDAIRQEFGLSGKLEYKPADRLTLWAGGRFAHYRNQDHNAFARAVREDREVRWIMVSRPDAEGYMTWFPDANGQYTDATDPRLHDGIVFQDTNHPFEGVPLSEFGATAIHILDPSVDNIVTGYQFGGRLRSGGHGFSPGAGIHYEVTPGALLHASFTQGLRLPSLFETSRGVQQTMPGIGLKPERSNSWEIGASIMRQGILFGHDSGAIKLVYFDNNVKNYITRYYDPSPSQYGVMRFSNADSFRTRGVELQSRYDMGHFFADLSATHYLKTETCDAAFAARLRKTANRYRLTQDTPDCTPGSFMGSYINTQNPPRSAANLTVGTRWLDERLIMGGRMIHTSGPTARADKPWQTGATTPQLVYLQTTLFDLFINYRLQESTMLNLSMQNLTNRYYLDPLAQSWMPAPGRTLQVGLQAKF